MRILRSRSSQFISSYPLPEGGARTPRQSKTHINLVPPRFPHFSSSFKLEQKKS